MLLEVNNVIFLQDSDSPLRHVTKHLFGSSIYPLKSDFMPNCSGSLFFKADYKLKVNRY